MQSCVNVRTFHACSEWQANKSPCLRLPLSEADHAKFPTRACGLLALVEHARHVELPRAPFGSVTLSHDPQRQDLTSMTTTRVDDDDDDDDDDDNSFRRQRRSLTKVLQSLPHGAFIVS